MSHPLDNLLGLGQPRDEEPEVEETEETEVEETEDEPLRDEGKQALDRMKEKERKARAELRAAKAELTALKEGKNEDDLRSTIRKEVSREFGVELAKEKAKSLLSEFGYRGNLARGVRALERDLSDVVDDDGKIDHDALSDLINDWKEDEPTLFKRSRNVDVDEEDDAPAQRRSLGSSDLGKKTAPRARPKDGLEQMLTDLVGRPNLA